MFNTSSKRPLSTGMVATLMEIHEREILGQDLCGQETKNIAGLFKRGFINMKNCVSKLANLIWVFMLQKQAKNTCKNSVNKLIYRLHYKTSFFI